MTTLLRTRQPLQDLSMSYEQLERRKSKRLAGASVWDEQDGDFHFTRGSKRVKTSLPDVDEDADRRVAPPKKTSQRGRATKERVAAAGDTGKPPLNAPPPVKKQSRRKASLESASGDEPQLVVPKRGTRRSTRKASLEAAEKTTPPPKATRKPAAKRKHDEAERDLVKTATPPPNNNGQSESPDADDSLLLEGAKITLPVSDTPVNNRNKEMRKKGGGNRRSSLGMRGRRASSLIESGFSAIPHREVATSEFYKHIEAEGLMEPRRMKQLLTWCGERALLPKPPHGSSNAHVINGARAVQEALLKDFSSRGECSNWFAREDVPKPPVVLQPNPRNLEHQEKVGELERKVERLKEEKEKWLALKATPTPDLPSLFPNPAAPAQGAAARAPPVLPELRSLDASETQMLSFLTDPETSFDGYRKRTQSRLQTVQSTLEFKIDLLADGVHKLLQRVDTAGREADRVLALSAERLKEREEREKGATGTREMPTMEVLRSLGRILPEGEG